MLTELFPPFTRHRITAKVTLRSLQGNPSNFLLLDGLIASTGGRMSPIRCGWLWGGSRGWRGLPQP